MMFELQEVDQGSNSFYTQVDLDLHQDILVYIIVCSVILVCTITVTFVWIDQAPYYGSQLIESR